MAYIRRAHLDAFWSREPQTVKHNLSSVKLAVNLSEPLGLHPFGPLGPWTPDFDHGMTEAILLLTRSQQPGRHEDLIKFSTVRKLRTAFTNVSHASAAGNAKTSFWRLEKKRGMSSSLPTDSEWFTRFMTGLEYRLGQRTKQDAAISIEVMKLLMGKLEADYQAGISSSDDHTTYRAARCGAFYIVAYCANMRGFEVPKISLTFIRDFIYTSQIGETPPHIGLPLTGRFKLQGNMEQNLLLFIALETESGLKPLVWIQRLIQELEKQNKIAGWLFQRESGDQARMNDFSDVFFQKLSEIQNEHPAFIPEGLDVHEAYGLSRSFRRGATTQAQNKGVSETDINWIARWSTAPKGNKSPYFQGDMRVHYSDQRQMVATFLRFSQAL